jgi:hypothetical protein
MIAVAFDRIEKAWMTVGGGGEDERVEWPEIDWSLVDYPRASSARLARKPSASAAPPCLVSAGE